MPSTDEALQAMAEQIEALAAVGRLVCNCRRDAASCPQEAGTER